jgi:hypothetical protein
MWLCARQDSRFVERKKPEPIMKTNTGQNMAGIPSPTPGSAEGTEDLDQQSQIPPSSHTPGSAESGTLDDETDTDTPQDNQSQSNSS